MNGDEDVTQVGGEAVQTNRRLHGERFLSHALLEQPRDGQPGHRQQDEAEVHRHVHEAGEALVVAVDGNDGALEGLEAPHVAVANHDQQQKHAGEEDFKLQQGGVFQLLEVVDLLEDPVGVEQHKGPVEHLAQQGVVGAHRISLAFLRYTAFSGTPPSVGL